MIRPVVDPLLAYLAGVPLPGGDGGGQAVLLGVLGRLEFVGVLEVVAELAVVVAGETALFAGVGALVGPKHGVGVQGPLGVLSLNSSGGRTEKLGRAVLLSSWWHLVTSGSRWAVFGSVVLTGVGPGATTLHNSLLKRGWSPACQGSCIDLPHQFHPLGPTRKVTF